MADKDQIETGERLVRNRTRYTVFTTRVIAVELPNDLVIPKGNIMVLPLSRPNTVIDLTKEQFAALFPDEAEAGLMVGIVKDQQDVSPPSSPPDILSHLAQRKGGVKANIIAKAVGLTIEETQRQLRVLRHEGRVLMEQGFWSLAEPPPPVARPAAAPERPKKTRVVSKVNGVTPQVGRILAAMLQAAKVHRTPDLTSKLVKPFLEDRDRRQYSARMPGAAEHGLVLKGDALPQGLGFYYRLTDKAVDVLREKARWAFEHDHIVPPEWLEQVLGEKESIEPRMMQRRDAQDRVDEDQD